MLTINVVGLPAPQGSKRGFYNKNLGRVQMVESSKKVAPWRQDVTAAALNTLAEHHGWQPPTKATQIDIVFHLPRPKAHYRTGNRAHELRPDAPEYVDKKPDLDKLVRSTLDALTTAGVLRDDCQVARLCVEKRYAGARVDAATARLFPGQAASGAQITIRALDTIVASPPGGQPEAAAGVQEALL